MRSLGGMVGQSMDGERHPLVQVLKYVSKTSGSGSVTAPPLYPTICEAFLIGGGGGADATGQIGAGGGGGAAYKRFPCIPGQSLAYSVGAAGAGGAAFGNGSDGGDTTLRLPSGMVLRAEGGKKNAGAGGQTGGLGGGAQNADLVRRGGDGGGNPAGGTGTAGAAGEHGGAGGALGGGTAGGGGGAGGFTDYGDFLAGAGGDGGTGAGAAPGGGGGASDHAGAAGAMVLIFTRLL